MDCNKEIPENDLKKLRSLISSVSNEIHSEIYESINEKISVFEVFYMDFESQEFINILSEEIKVQIMKIAKILNFPKNSIRINFQVRIKIDYI